MIDYKKVWSKKMLNHMSSSNLIEIKYIKKWYHKLFRLKGKKIYTPKCNNFEFVGINSIHDKESGV